jgi:type III pantothenate kinase
MLLAIDIGNTAMKFGVFDGDELRSKFVLPTHSSDVPAELRRTLDCNLAKTPNAVIFSSVVPGVDAAVSEFFLRTGITARQIKTTDDFGLNLTFPVDGFGTDRLVNSFAAAEIYGAPCIVIAFGTASTIDAVDQDRAYLGGLIAPGPRTSAKALKMVTSKLPEVEVNEVTTVINTDTMTAIQAGVFYSQIGLVETAIPRIKAEIGADAKVVATGGFAPLLADKCHSIGIVEPDLTLYGLKMLYSRA